MIAHQLPMRSARAPLYLLAALGLSASCGQATRASTGTDESTSATSGGNGGSGATDPSSTSTASSATGGAKCIVGGLLEECPAGSFCLAVDQNANGPIYRCASYCDYDEDCDAGEECYSPDSAGGPKLCSPARPECEPTASEGECSCSTVGSAVLVRGTGDDCEVVSADASACYWQNGTCLDACVREYYRYELDDGTALIVGALQGEMPSGWVSDGQGDAPESCPAVPAEEL